MAARGRRAFSFAPFPAARFRLFVFGSGRPPAQVSGFVLLASQRRPSDELGRRIFFRIPHFSTRRLAARRRRRRARREHSIRRRPDPPDAAASWPSRRIQHAAAAYFRWRHSIYYCGGRLKQQRRDDGCAGANHSARRRRRPLNKLTNAIVLAAAADKFKLILFDNGAQK